jgi:hypothetical protein
VTKWNDEIGSLCFRRSRVPTNGSNLFAEPTHETAQKRNDGIRFLLVSKAFRSSRENENLGFVVFVVGFVSWFRDSFFHFRSPFLNDGHSFLRSTLASAWLTCHVFKGCLSGLQESSDGGDHFDALDAMILGRQALNVGFEKR